MSGLRTPTDWEKLALLGNGISPDEVGVRSSDKDTIHVKMYITGDEIIIRRGEKPWEGAPE